MFQYSFDFLAVWHSEGAVVFVVIDITLGKFCRQGLSGQNWVNLRRYEETQQQSSKEKFHR